MLAAMCGTLVALGAGYYALVNTPIDAIPDQIFPWLEVPASGDFRGVHTRIG